MDQTTPADCSSIPRARLWCSGINWWHREHAAESRAGQTGASAGAPAADRLELCVKAQRPAECPGRAWEGDCRNFG